MPTKYRFVTTGDYVEFYDDSMLVITIHNTSRIIEWSFDSTPGIVFNINELQYHTDAVGDISFDGVAVTSQSDFVTKMETMFPGLAGGSGTDPGIDDVLAKEQGLTENRSVSLNDKILNFNGNLIVVSFDDETGVFSVVSNGQTFSFSNGFFVLQNVSAFANNAAAISGGVPNNAFYYTDDAGERIVKIAHD